MKDNKYAFQFAQKQRLIALKNAFKTIDAFAQPSLDPETYSNYEDVKSNLIKNYSRKIK